MGAIEDARKYVQTGEEMLDAAEREMKDTYGNPTTATALAAIATAHFSAAMAITNIELAAPSEPFYLDIGQ